MIDLSKIDGVLSNDSLKGGDLDIMNQAIQNEMREESKFSRDKKRGSSQMSAKSKQRDGRISFMERSRDSRQQSKMEEEKKEESAQGED